MHVALALLALLAPADPPADGDEPAPVQATDEPAAAPSTTTSTPVAPAPEPAVPEDPRARRAADDLAAGHADAAARAFEALHAEVREPAYLLQAARARLAAGHRAHAIAYLSGLLAGKRLAAADVQVAYALLQQAQQAVTPVTVRVHLPPPLVGARELRLVAEVDLAAEAPRPSLAFPLPGGAEPVRMVMLQLDRGVWRLRVEHPGAAPASARVVVEARPGPAVQLDLRPRGADVDDLPRQQRRRMAGVVTGLGVGLAATGMGLAAAGQVLRVEPVLSRSLGACTPDDGCRKALADAVTFRNFGGTLLGAGVGAAIGGLTGLIRDPRRRRAAWAVELAIGGAGVIAGSFATSLSARGFDRANTGPWGDQTYVDTIDRRAWQHALASAGLGLGAGLAASAAIGMVRTRIYHARRRVRPDLALSPAMLGLGVSGSF
jgi:hypothetical protein